jgi:RND family efflux transporter MFP subunit
VGAFREAIGKATTRAAAFLLVILAAGCGQDRADATAKAKQDAPRAVHLVTAEPGSLPRVVTVTGTLAAEDQVVLNTEVAGRLAELPVDLGSVVREGDVVAVLDLTDFLLKVEQAETALAQARARLGVPLDGSGDTIQPEKTSLVRQARAVLDQARRQRERMTTLHGEGILAKAELDQVDADYRVAEARLQEAFEEVRNRQAIVAERRAALGLAKQQLAEATLRAPFDGAVRERRVSVGAYLDVGAAVVTIVRIHPLRLRLAVPERDAASMRVGQRVRLREEGTGTAAEGGLVRLSPAVDEGTRTLMVEAEIPNLDGALRPGAFATADIVVDPKQAVILLPASAIVTFAGVTKVVTVADGRAVEKRVQVGRKSGDLVEVTSGLAAGESVVAEPGTLSAGQPVVVE